ncbi:MAG: hypothetical protein CMO98_14040 [Woeseia sp.]|nr:hypothetical protein [Woeseia sp.]|tara:strand:- start:515 stop:733 length:219 start_codon:yes stop_codon:yes gene_type:complete
MNLIANCPQKDCPEKWDALSGCGESHLGFCSHCFRKVQLVETVDAIKSIDQLGLLAAGKKPLISEFNSGKNN